MLLRELLVVAILCGPGVSAAEPLSATAVRTAASAVQADPSLGQLETFKHLQFKKDDSEKKNSKPLEVPGRWWIDLLANLSGGLRVAVWLIGAGVFIGVLLRLRDWLKEREAVAAPAIAMPSHVGTLDIRPQSLPRDVGGAARELWHKGELRAALSLLYRGALSRLVHSHGVPIRSASTENDCLHLASARVAPDARDYLQRLIGGWQAVAYAKGQILPEEIERLCASFDEQLPELSARRPA